MSSEARFRGVIHEDEVRSAIKSGGFRDSEWVILDKDICRNMPIIKLVK